MLVAFTSFSNLPVELQDIVWQFSLSEPRSISGEDFFREWWKYKIIRVPVALHVCSRSRSQAKRILKCTTIQIPGVSGSRIFYLNQAHDYFLVTAKDVQMGLKVSRFISEPALVNRVVVSCGLPNGDSAINIINYLDHLSGLEEVVLTDRARLYLICHREFLKGDQFEVPANKLALVHYIQKTFSSRNKHVNVSGCWFTRDKIE